MEDLVQQLKSFEALEEYINKRVKEQLKDLYSDKYESEKTDMICGALAKAQGEFPVIVTNRTNNFMFRQYSDLHTILEAVRAPLKANGLSITFQERLEDEKTIIATRVRHESSQWIETRTRLIPSKNDIQTFKSDKNEKKKSSLMDLLNLAVQDDPDDDDGEWDMKTVREERAKGTGLNVRYSAKRESYETITTGEEQDLQKILANYPDIAEDMLLKLRIEAFVDMPRSKYDDVKKQALMLVKSRETVQRS